MDEPQGFPKITQVSSASKVVELGQNTALNCETTGNPKPQITWLKEMNPINYTKHVFITPDGWSWFLTPFIDKLNHNWILVSGSLHILNSEEYDQGKYECVAENNLGSDHSATINLYVRSKFALI